MKTLIALTVLFLTSTAFAAATHSCDGLDSIGLLIGNAQSFDSIKVAYVSTEEPAAAPDHLLVFVYGDEMSLSCTAISERADEGFGYIDMKTLKSIGYDSKKGRLLQVVVNRPMTDTDDKVVHETIKFRVNAQTGLVTLE